MDSKRIIESSSASPLLFRGNVESQSQRYDSSSDDVASNHQQHKQKITPSPPTLTLTTLVAVFGSYVFGTAVSFSPFSF
jgi:hypothetical protein